MNKIYFSLAILFLSSIGFISAQNNIPDFVLTNAIIINNVDGTLQKSCTIQIKGNKIIKIDTNAYHLSKKNKKTKVLDLKGDYVLTGLWNNHSHLSDLLPDTNYLLENESTFSAVFRSTRNATDALKAGFTTLRVVGEQKFIDVALKKAFDEGVFVGPRIIPSGNPISSHGDGDWLVKTAKGTDGIKKAVESNIKNGAEIIKIMVDRMQNEEIKIAIETAHKLGIKVTGHASDEKARIAINYGIDMIEHGYFLSDATIQLMADKKVFYDPTIVCNLSADYIKERENRIKSAGFISSKEVIDGRILVAYNDERDDDFAKKQREILQKAVKAGVKVTTGSDSNPISEIGLLEIEQLVFSGLSELDAIKAATINSAEAMGMQDDLGTIEVGKLADLIVLEKNPLENISNIRTLKMVIKDGKLVNLNKNEGEKSFWELYILKK